MCPTVTSHLIENTWPQLCRLCTFLVTFCRLNVTVVVSVSCTYYRVMPGKGVKPDPELFFPVFAAGSYVFQGGPNSQPVSFFPDVDTMMRWYTMSFQVKFCIMGWKNSLTWRRFKVMMMNVKSSISTLTLSENKSLMPMRCPLTSAENTDWRGRKIATFSSTNVSPWPWP